MHFAPDQGTYVYFRYDGKQKIMVVLNKNKTEKILATNRFREILPQNAAGTDVISGRRFELGNVLTVPARTVLILEVKQSG